MHVHQIRPEVGADAPSMDAWKSPRGARPNAAIRACLPGRTILAAYGDIRRRGGWTRHPGPLPGPNSGLDRPTERCMLRALAYVSNPGPVWAARHPGGAGAQPMIPFVNRRHLATFKRRGAQRDLIDTCPPPGLVAAGAGRDDRGAAPSSPLVARYGFRAWVEVGWWKVYGLCVGGARSTESGPAAVGKPPSGRRRALIGQEAPSQGRTWHEGNACCRRLMPDPRAQAPAEDEEVPGREIVAPRGCRGSGPRRRSPTALVRGREGVEHGQPRGIRLVGRVAV